MGERRTFAMWQAISVLILPLISLSGCDYWPPALHTEIDQLRAELNDAVDEQQRLSLENTELKSIQSALERDVEEKTRENEVLKNRVAALNRTAKSNVASTRAPSVKKSPFIPVQAGQPAAHGPRVVQIQRLLQQHGLRLHADGWYGRETERVVREFQRSHGLRADGIVGPATSVALHRQPRSVRSVRQLALRHPPVSGDDVITIQRALRRAGYQVAVDGHFGQQTEVAVARFQRARGLHPDGVVGPRTWKALTRRGR